MRHLDDRRTIDLQQDQPDTIVEFVLLGDHDRHSVFSIRVIRDTDQIHSADSADCVIYPQSLPVLLHMLRTNKTLAYLEMSAYLTAEDYGQIASAMSKSILRLSMQNAYEDFGVGEVLRQNLLRMNRAVEFVTDPEDFVECECVRDFEDVLDTASFARHFAQGHPQDNSCLPSMLACAKRCIKECFFEFSGICRDKVSLCESSGKPILNYECWQHVFSFLTLNSVVW